MIIGFRFESVNVENTTTRSSSVELSEVQVQVEQSSRGTRDYAVSSLLRFFFFNFLSCF